MQSSPNSAAMTRRQRLVYDYIAACIRDLGYPPTIREIGDHMGIRSTNGVADHLKALMRKGFLEQTATKSRTWRPLPLGKAANTRSHPSKPLKTKPLISLPQLGDVEAGKALRSSEQASEVLQLDASLLPKNLLRSAKFFTVQVASNAMLEAGIARGDTLCVHKTTKPASGSLVIVTIDQQAHLKRYVLRRNRIVFKAANKKARDMVISANSEQQVTFLGVVVGVYHRLT